MKSNKIRKVQTFSLDIEELACEILGLDSDEVETSEVERLLYEEFEIDFETFQEIINRLLPLIDVGISPLTGERNKGFSNQGGGCWLVKTKVE
jgi:hypothetical protein